MNDLPARGRRGILAVGSEREIVSSVDNEKVEVKIEENTRSIIAPEHNRSEADI